MTPLPCKSTLAPKLDSPLALVMVLKPVVLTFKTELPLCKAVSVVPTLKVVKELPR